MSSPASPHLWWQVTLTYFLTGVQNLATDNDFVSRFFDNLGARNPMLVVEDDHLTVSFEVSTTSHELAVSLATRMADDALHAVDLGPMPVQRILVTSPAYVPQSSLAAVCGVAEAAEILEVSPQRVVQLAKTKHFPAPWAKLRSGTLWKRADIETFAKGRSRHKTVAAQRQAPPTRMPRPRK